MVEWHEMPDTETVTSEMSGAYRHSYNEKDRYQDFVKVFRGSEEGLRVLHQILQWGHIYGSSIQEKPIHVPVDSNAVLINEGERRLALKILSTVNVKPAEGTPPKRTTIKEPKDV